MIVFLTLIYVALLFVLIKMGRVSNSAMTWATVPIWMVLLLIVLFIPMQIGAPSGPVRLLTNTISVVPNVSGTVTKVDAIANRQVEEGAVLFTIDPAPFEYQLQAKRAALAESEQAVLQLQANLEAADAAVDEATAQRDLSKQTYERFAEGNKGDTKPFTEQEVEATRLTYLGDEAALERAIANRNQASLAASSEIDGINTTVARLRAEVDRAAYDLEQTVVRAPTAGFATYVALRPGQRVTNLPLQPALSFIDTSERVIVAQIGQIYQRHIREGQPVELALKTRAGKIYSGTVESAFKVSAQGQTEIGGTLPLPEQVQALPLFVRIKMDDDAAALDIPAGTVGTAAIYTNTAAMTHIIRKVMIRMESYMNYVVPTL